MLAANAFLADDAYHAGDNVCAQEFGSSMASKSHANVDDPLLVDMLKPAPLPRLEPDFFFKKMFRFKCRNVLKDTRYPEHVPCLTSRQRSWYFVSQSDSIVIIHVLHFIIFSVTVILCVLVVCTTFFVPVIVLCQRIENGEKRNCVIV